MKLLSILTIIISFATCGACQKTTNNPNIKSQNMNINYSESKKIYSKKIKEDLTIEFFRKESNQDFIWELYIITPKKKENIKKILIKKDEIKKSSGFAHGIREGYQEKLNVLDALLNDSQNELIVLFDKFGQIDIHIFKLNIDFNSNQFENTIHIKNYTFLPMDTQLKGEKFQDFKLENGTYHLLLLPESNYNTYLFYDINNDAVKELIFNVSDSQKNAVSIKEDSQSPIIHANYNTKNIVEGILKDVVQKSPFKNNTFNYHYNIENIWSKKSYEESKQHLGNQFFFIDINGKAKIMMYDGARSWYISDYNYLLYKDKNAKNIDNIIEKIKLSP
ncbi:hypothetical protein QWZ06_17160 [Chryseobacterium tructae]|uniref:Uncharacterized protein n=1 Tax=Chryseobacterium tructae TaxID=1037380 RepID=A0ABV7XYT7_9FLAO|nr:hypothetical protein [Chryseobacterium tructae]MDN3693889.1 hypothetical protein [Chryseobacterium tructae]